MALKIYKIVQVIKQIILKKVQIIALKIYKIVQIIKKIILKKVQVID